MQAKLRGRGIMGEVRSHADGEAKVLALIPTHTKAAATAPASGVPETYRYGLACVGDRISSRALVQQFSFWR